MALREKSTTASRKSLWFKLGVMVLLVATQIVFVESRALRSMENFTAGGYEQVTGLGGSVAVVPSSTDVASNNSTSRPSVRSLAYKLASGPSKKGPGH